MELNINDIVAILGIDLLEQSTINNLNPDDIKKLYRKTIKLYHPDLHNLDNPSDIYGELTKIINAAYSQALLQIEELKKYKTRKGVETRFNSGNYPDIFKFIIAEIELDNNDMIWLLRSLRAIDNGFIIPAFLTKVGDILGHDFKSLFFLALDSELDEKLFDMSIKLMQDHISHLKEFKEQTHYLINLENQTNKSM